MVFISDRGSHGQERHDRREHDKKIGAGTVSVGVTCPCCGTIMTMED
jgi:hypothetical protein